MSEYDVMRRLLTARPIVFHPELAIVLGGVYEALMFQQLAYWSDKGSDPDGWIYKTTEEFRQETTINRYQQDKARAALVKLGVIQAKRRGLPARMHYLIEWRALYDLLSTPVCSPSTNSEEPPPTDDEPVCSPSTNLSVDAGQTLLGTETTSEMTQSNGPPPYKNEPFIIAELGLPSAQVWHAILDELARAGAIPSHEIATWLRPTVLAGRDQQTLLLRPPSAVAGERITRRWLPELRCAIAATTGATFDVRVVGHR